MTERQHTAHMTQAVDEPDAAERRVIAAVKGLRAMQGVPISELCALLHMSRGTWFARMNDGQFTVGQVAKLAERFGVKIQAIFDGVAYSQADDVRGSGRGGLPTVPEVTLPKLTPYLHVIDGEADISPRIGRLVLVA